ESYVLQVVLVTLGFCVLLAVVAVVDTPNDAFQPMVAAPYVISTPSKEIPGKDAKSGQPSPGLANFGDECDLFFRFAIETETSPKQECDTSTSPHKKGHQGSQHGAKTSTADDC